MYKLTGLFIIQVDAILLGGDLFHHNKPSRNTMHKTMELLRTYCFGDKPCPLEILSDQRSNFPNRFGVANYQDPNFNIGMPVFSIHGNHDDPMGDNNLAAIDLLSVAGMMNYFGQSSDLSNIKISPILIRKANTKLALYGLGNVRDERLHRTFRQNKVSLLRPAEDSEGWFNLLLIHQNRVKHGETNYIPESFLDDSLHLILWGHEHECQIDPNYNPQQQFYVTQPGSSVATSLSEGESKVKHVGILSIKGKDFKIDKIRLRSVRPFVIEDVILKDHRPMLQPHNIDGVNKFLAKRVSEMILRAKREWMNHNGCDNCDDMPLPLVRLRVEYTEFSSFNPQRFGQQFVDKIANSRDCLNFFKQRTYHTLRKTRVANDDTEDLVAEKLDGMRLDNLVDEMLQANMLDALPENELGEAVKLFVDKDEKEAIKDFFEKSVKRTQKALQLKNIVADESAIETEAKTEKQKRVELYNTRNGIKPAASHSKNDDTMRIAQITNTKSETMSLDAENDPDVANSSTRKNELSYKSRGAKHTDSENESSDSEQARKRKRKISNKISSSIRRPNKRRNETISRNDDFDMGHVRQKVNWPSN